MAVPLWDGQINVGAAKLWFSSYSFETGAVQARLLALVQPASSRGAGVPLYHQWWSCYRALFNSSKVLCRPSCCSWPNKHASVHHVTCCRWLSS